MTKKIKTKNQKPTKKSNKLGVKKVSHSYKVTRSGRLEDVLITEDA